MRLLVLGGTVFLSRAVAEAAIAHGHDVTVASRGASGEPPTGARHVITDRDAALPDALTDPEWDVVVDVARRPSQVRSALAGLRAEHWVYVSTISVYADDATRDSGPGTLALHDPLTEDGDAPEHYGPMKLGAEHLVTASAPSHTIVRPGLIVGPGDPTGRFTYWVDRLRRAADDEVVLAPGDPADPVQFIDARDLAAWIVLLAERRTAGVFDAVAEQRPIHEALDEIAAAVGVRPRWRWATDAELEAADVAPWMGPRALPLWLPRPGYDGMMTHRAAPAFAAGLAPRPVADTARDVLTWLEASSDAARTGLTADEEAEVLAGLT